MKISRAVLCLLLMQFLGCSSLFTSSKPSNSYHIHRVAHQGETLSIIADWYTGSLYNWKVILPHNKRLRINRIQLGERIFIPRQLLVRHAPLPKGIIEKFQRVALEKAAERTCHGVEEVIDDPQLRLEICEACSHLGFDTCGVTAVNTSHEL